MFTAVMEEVAMLTLLGMLMAIAPFAAMLGALAWTSRRERLRREAQTRQVALLAIVLDAFVRPDRDRHSLEIVLTRQLDPPAKPASARRVARESPSWT